MVLKKVETTESKPEEKVRIMVVASLPTQEVRETIIDGEKVRFMTVEECLSEMMNN